MAFRIIQLTANIFRNSEENNVGRIRGQKKRAVEGSGCERNRKTEGGRGRRNTFKRGSKKNRDDERRPEQGYGRIWKIEADWSGITGKDHNIGFPRISATRRGSIFDWASGLEAIAKSPSGAIHLEARKEIVLQNLQVASEFPVSHLVPSTQPIVESTIPMKTGRRKNSQNYATGHRYPFWSLLNPHRNVEMMKRLRGEGENNDGNEKEEDVKSEILDHEDVFSEDVYIRKTCI
ncbi:hypothetical protein JOM56_009421 [Amanita muscaria]